jgi:hypothetical protein
LPKALEIAAVHRFACRRIVVAIGVIIGGIAVEKAVGDDLVDAL